MKAIALKCADMAIFRFVSIMLITAFMMNSTTAAEKRICSVVLESRKKDTDFVVTFAHPFRKGDVKETVVLKVGDEDIGAQVDIKRRYADNSVKHAIISVPVKRAEPGRPLKLGIYPTNEKKLTNPVIQDFPDGFSTEVIFRFPDGSRRRANALEFYRKAVSGAERFHLAKWLQGPLTSEIRLIGPPYGDNEDLDPDLLVIFGLRLFKPGKTVRVEITVESPWVDVPGNVPYDIAAFVAGEQVMSQKSIGYWNHRMPYWLKDKDRNLGHFAHARWKKIYWWPGKPPETHIRYELPYLVSTLLIPPYDINLDISSEQLDRGLKRWEQSPRGVLENGIIMAYFPTTGGREDLGPYPTWTARYLFSQDSRAWNMVLGTGDLAGSFPVHIRDRKTSRIFSIDNHPGFSLNPRGTLEKIQTRSALDRPYILPVTSPYQVDNAHQPSLAFIPYLLTGDYYYLEEMYFWANWCMLIQNAAYRQKEKGLIAPDQTRGEAWALRQLVDAAKIAPDSHHEKQYFDSKVKSNLQYYCSFVEGQDATPLGTYTLGASDAYVRGRSPQERQKWLTLAPWQQNFLVWSLDHAFRAGYTTAAEPRDYFTRLQVGVLTHPNVYDIRYAASYFLVIGERVGSDKQYYTTWKELFEKSFHVVSPDTKPGMGGLDYGSSYAYIGRAVLLNGVRNKVPGSHEALQVLESNLPNSLKVLSGDPTWAFTP